MREIQLTAMEAGTGAATPPPPPPPPPGASSGKASGGLRALAAIGFLVIAFGTAVIAVAAADIGKTPTCADVQSGKAALPSDRQCFDGGHTKRTATVALMWPGAALGAIAALLALAFAFTGRNGRRLLLVLAAAIVLSGLGVLVGSV